MRRTISMALAIIMIFGIFSFPAGADPVKADNPGEFLKQLGILKGDEKGNLNENATLKREEAIAILIRMLGKEKELAKIEKKEVFKDVKSDHWSASYVQYAKEQGYTQGIGEGSFGLGQELSAKQFITLMLRALNHSADWAKEDIIKKAKELGLLEDVDLDDEIDDQNEIGDKNEIDKKDDDKDDDLDKEDRAAFDKPIKRRDVFQIMKNALYTKPKDAAQNLITIIGANENANYKRFEILKVAANSKVIKLWFNQDIDEKEIEAHDINQKVTFIGSDQGKIKVLDVEDEEMLLEVEKPMADAKRYQVQIQKIRSQQGFVLGTAVLEFQIEKKEFAPLTPNPPQTPTPPQTPAPQNPADNNAQPDAKPFHVANLITDNLKDFEIKFSEKIDKTSLVDPQDPKVKQQIMFVGEDLGTLRFTEIDDEEVILEIEKSFDIAKEYTIKIEHIRSASGKTLVPVTMKFKISRLEAPEVEEIKPIGPDEILIEFSEPIRDKGSVILSTGGNRPITVEADKIRIDGRKAFVTTPELKDKETYEAQPVGFTDYEGKTHSKAKFKFTFDLHSVLIK